MCTVLTGEVRLLHAVPGRLRVHLPSWLGAERERLAAQLQATVGVLSAHFNALTSNLLVQVDAAQLSTASVWALVQRFIWCEPARCDARATIPLTGHAMPARPAEHSSARSARRIVGAVPGGTSPVRQQAGGNATAVRGTWLQPVISRVEIQHQLKRGEGYIVPRHAGVTIADCLQFLGRWLVRMLIGPTPAPVRLAGVAARSALRPQPLTRQLVWAMLGPGAVELAVQAIVALVQAALL